ncbi:MAG: HlyD family efflux transporter periplasmic adaptor subunit [Oscillospiraceae bacterium]
MNSILTKILGALAVMVLMTYICFQAYTYVNKPYVTETVVPYSVAQSLNIKGIAIRDEEIIDASYNGKLRYLYSDATKVTGNAPIAQVFASADDAAAAESNALLTEQIDNLKAVQNLGDDQLINTDMLNRDIAGQVGKIINISQSNMVEGVQKDKLVLTDLLNKKMASLDENTDYNTYINKLEEDLKFKQSNFKGPVGYIKSPMGGYFVKTTDGYENLMKSDILDEINYTEFEKLMNDCKPQTVNSDIGKVVTSHIWYFVASVTDKQLEQFMGVETVELNFKLTDTKPVHAEVLKLITQRPDKNLVVFKCKTVSDELMQLRYANAEVIFRYYSGYRVSADAIRFVDGQESVYVVDSYEMKLTPIYPVYRQSSFVLCDPKAVPETKDDNTETPPTNDKPSGKKEKSEPPNKLKMFDEVIVKGTDLYDGKPISR